MCVFVFLKFSHIYIWAPLWLAVASISRLALCNRIGVETLGVLLEMQPKDDEPLAKNQKKSARLFDAQLSIRRRRAAVWKNGARQSRTIGVRPDHCLAVFSFAFEA